MQYYYKPEVMILKGEDAIEVLEEYIKELEEGKPEELTESQTEAMVKVAKGLISGIEEETTILNNVKQSHFVPKLKATISRFVSKVSKEHVEPVLSRSKNF